MSGYVQIYNMDLIHKWSDLCRMKYDKFVKEMAIPQKYSVYSRYCVSLGLLDDCEILLFVEDKKPITLRIIDYRSDRIDDYDLDTEMELLKADCYGKH